MASVEERVAVVEEKVEGLDKWRVEHCAIAERQADGVTKLTAEIAVLAAQVALLVGSQGNLWRLVRWLALALIAMAAAALGIREVLPIIIKGGL